MTITLDAAPLSVQAGVSLAAALLIAGCVPFRGAAITGAPRAPQCMIGHCYECLLEVDGEPGVQACLTPVRTGMEVRRVMAPLEGAAGG